MADSTRSSRRRFLAGSAAVAALPWTFGGPAWGDEPDGTPGKEAGSPGKKYRAPGGNPDFVPGKDRPIAEVGTSVAGFLGAASHAEAPRDQAVSVHSWTEYVRGFVDQKSGASTDLDQAVYGFFSNGGGRCHVVNVDAKLPLAGQGGPLEQLAKVEEVAIVAAPGRADFASHEALREHCERQQDRIAILDPPAEVDDWRRFEKFEDGKDGGLRPTQSDGGYTALYYPWITVSDLLNPRVKRNVPPSGHVAGAYARTDIERGVHKAPANVALRGVIGLAHRVTDQQQQILNPLGVNCIRQFAGRGILIWGARTTAPATSEYRYVPVRRTVLMIEESIEMSTRWTVFEPNDQALWTRVSRDVERFLSRLWQSGALVGQKPEQAFFVRCDANTNPPEQVKQSRFAFQVGLAALKPAEFLILHFEHSA